MGLSIHYNGSFNAGASLHAMIEEVKNIAEVHQWQYHIFETEFPANSIGKIEYDQNIYGICFSPPECEPIWLCFLSNGRMSSPIDLELYGNSKNKKEREYLYMLSTKTQYAGIEIHKLIIHLFKYINQKYLQDFNLSDEGKYWETGDEKLLQDIFKRYTDLIESFAYSLENYPRKSGENYEAYFKRLLEQIQEKHKK